MSAVRGRAGAHVRGGGNPLTDPFARQAGGLQSDAGCRAVAGGAGKDLEESGMGATEPEFMGTRHVAARLGLSPRTLGAAG